MTDIQVFADGLIELQFVAKNSKNQYARFHVDDELFSRLLGMEKNFFYATFVLTDDNGKHIPIYEGKPDKKPDKNVSAGGKFVRDLLHSGLFNRLEVLEKFGTDEDFQAWVREQPSCLSRKEPCVYAHVRRANNSGVSIKPKYSGVPLTDEEHKLQHQKGEAAALEVRIKGVSPEKAKEWFDKQASWYRWDWATKKVAAIHGADSRADIHPDEWRAYLSSELDINLPRQLL